MALNPFCDETLHLYCSIKVNHACFDLIALHQAIEGLGNNLWKQISEFLITYSPNFVKMFDAIENETCDSDVIKKLRPSMFVVFSSSDFKLITINKNKKI